eukprot:scaffold1431_cov346-Pavlova_lutheri.AAC.35
MCPGFNQTCDRIAYLSCRILHGRPGMEAKARHEAFPYTNVPGLPQEWRRCTRVDLNAGEAEATCPYDK